jgi:myo-inositol-1(or 4)-monophosphatase
VPVLKASTDGSRHDLEAMNTRAEIRDWMGDRLREAGRRAVEGRLRLGVEMKGPSDVVTDLDTEIEEWMIRELESAFPGWGVVAEESRSGGEDLTAGRCWVLDPLDGTVNFANRLPIYSLSLALLEEGEPVVGVVVDPVHNEVFDAYAAGGARCNGATIQTGLHRSAVDAVAISSGVLARLASTGNGQGLTRLLNRCPKTRILGSQALHLCYVASGRLAAAASAESYVWDDAAGALIVAESGARYTRFDGFPIFPVDSVEGKLESLAGRPADHDWMLEIFSGLKHTPEAEQ